MKDSLTITAVDVHRVEKAVERPYRLSYGMIDRFFGYVFEIQADGITGVGESLTDDEATAVQAAKTLVGKDARQLGRLTQNINVTNQESRACREGLTFALYDLAGKADRVPVWQLLGGRRRTELTLRPVVFVEDPGLMAAEVSRLMKAGFAAVKIKFLGNVEQDAVSLAGVRQAVGHDLDVQADANMGYRSESQFLALVERIRGLNLGIIEDPCRLSDDGYAGLREKLKDTGIRLMLDEPVRTVADIERICRIGAADIINQHPNCQGGPDCLQVGQALAEGAGLTNVIGGITGYFGIGDISYYSVAAAIGTGCVEQTPTEVYQGVRLAPHPHSIKDGKVYLNETITGCGVELDRKALERVCAKTVEIR